MKQLNTSQVMKKFGVSNYVVHRMVRDGELKPINAKVEGKRYHPVFDSTVIAQYLREKGKPAPTRGPKRKVKVNGAAEPAVKAKRRPTSLVRGVNTQLAEMNGKLDQVLKMLGNLVVAWS